MSVRRLIACYGGWMVVLAAVYFAVPGARVAAWALIGMSSVAAIVAGTRHHRPRKRRPWYLLALAVTAFVAGDTVGKIDLGGGPAEWQALLSGVLYLAIFPLMTAAMIMLANAGGNRDPGSLLDSYALAAGVGLFLWVALVSPNVRNPDLTDVDKISVVCFALGDVVLLALSTRLLLEVRRGWAVVLVILGAAGLFTADILYGLLRLAGTWASGGPVDLGWFAFYLLWGAAALHPSMTGLTEPRPPRPRSVNARRLWLPAVALVTGPTVLMYQVENGGVTDGTAIALMSTLIIWLGLSRLAGVVRTHQQTLNRERGLRSAGAALVSATGLDEIDTILREATARLLPAGTPHAVLVERRPEDAACLVRRDGVLLRSAAELPPSVRDQLGGFALALVCPMTVGSRDGDGGGRDCGALAVAAAEVELVNLQGVIEVLAGQAALAWERIRLASEINRRASEEYFRTLVQNTADVILILDEQMRVRYASPSAAQMFGAGPLTGTSLFDLVDSRDAGRAGDLIDMLQPGESHADSADWRLHDAGGMSLRVSASVRDLRQDPTVRGLVVTFRDVTARRQLEHDLTRQTFHDSLTGLANRVLFQERLQQAVTRAGRTGGLIGVLLINLDGFKAVNDASGHQTGDRLLAMVAQRLRSTLRSADTAARLGGDEFAVLAEDLSSPVEINAMVARIVDEFAEPFDLGDMSVLSSAGIGVASTADADTAAELLRQADLALHVAKRAGKAQWRRYQPSLHTPMLQQQQLRADLEQAIADEEFTLHFQPLVELGSGITLGMEALVRWQHPQRGMVPPDQFIPLAEETGLIVPLGLWVLEQGLAAAVTWRDLRPERPPYVSVNVSARQFRTTGFADEVMERLTAAGLPPSGLLLEITESMLLRDDEQAWTHLATLREHGIRVAIDDFGTGYSSLSYLRQVSVDVVKIDKSFVDGLGNENPHQNALVEGIVKLAQTLDLGVVAEGIEEPGDHAALHAMGCPYGQGYLFSRPLPGEDAERWFRENRAAAPLTPLTR
ncbi:putative bifunctional diguanylate cyclase/phosphodiesterase [Paractinoplanes rishiriensis]|uniref:Uncharacterized protein n=1 Tax=Paractinoplanes rishiriensis TaxID=1050105 RepID=A0A919K5Q9_9ACTN|nr:EAL domain-containing protein [Actinoplanes rishiriensis]GIE99430.1 hypothetical protein Ari01nite_68950 [Actinoplanes rishiriensis]